jgi:hypothetical protein
MAYSEKTNQMGKTKMINDYSLKYKKNNMNGKILLDYWKKHYDEVYHLNKEWYVFRDSIAKVVYLLKLSNDVTEEEYLKMLRLLHSLDIENWTVLEAIIEQIDTSNKLPENF